MSNLAFTIPLAVMIAIAFIVLDVIGKRLDPTRKLETPAVPPDPDPQLVGYLRAGAMGVVPGTIVDMIRRGILSFDTTQRLVTAPGHARSQHDGQLTALESNIVSLVRSGGKDGYPGWQLLSAMQQPAEAALQDVKSRCQIEQWLNPPSRQRKFLSIGIGLGLVIFVAGTAKLLLGLIDRDENNTALIVVTLFGTVLLMGWPFTMKRRTSLGQRFLTELKIGFSDLRHQPLSRELPRELQVTCKACGTQLQFPPAVAGTQSVCTQCGELVNVPMAVVDQATQPDPSFQLALALFGMSAVASSPFPALAMVFTPLQTASGSGSDGGCGGCGGCGGD